MDITLRRIKIEGITVYAWVVSGVQPQLMADVPRSGREGLVAKLSDSEFQILKQEWAKDEENQDKNIVVKNGDVAYYLHYEQLCALWI